MTVQEFAEKVKLLRQEYDQAIRTGVIPEGLPSAISALQDEEEQLLTAALPAERRRFLQTRDPGAEVTNLVKDAGDLSETSLTEEEKALCQKLLQLDPPEEPMIPSVCFDETAYSGSAYITAASTNTCFLFLDDGTVILFENNNGWEYRKKPILDHVFPENAIIESDHSCLILNLDHGIDRISYHRLETAEDLYQLPLFR